MLLIISDPTAALRKRMWYSCGRGGIANRMYGPEQPSDEAVPLHLTTSSTLTDRSASSFHSGRGGLGNVHGAEDAVDPVESFVDEVVRAQSRGRRATIGHVGIGGAGNCYRVLPAAVVPASSHSSACLDGVDDAPSTVERTSVSNAGSRSSVYFWRRRSE